MNDSTKLTEFSMARRDEFLARRRMLDAEKTTPPEVRESPHRKSYSDQPFDLLIVIDKRPLERECLVECLSRQSGPDVVGFATVAEWRRTGERSGSKQVVLNNIGSRSLRDPQVRAKVRALVHEVAPLPTVLLGTSETIDTSILALELGAAGYIPPCVHVSDIAAAAHLVIEGGSLVVSASLRALATPMENTTSKAVDIFTERQLSVAQILRRGAANKTIAYELDMQEGTVKVHIRNIFQKLKATNRTQAAFMLNQMSGWPDACEMPTR